MMRIFYILLLCFAIAACERAVIEGDGGGKDEVPSGTGSGHRPGVGLPTDTDVMLGDDVPRYVSQERSLRADVPGILVSRDSHGNYTFINLDTRERVDVYVDNTMTVVKIVECGKEIRPVNTSVLGDDGTVMWILAETADSRLAIVLPYF